MSDYSTEKEQIEQLKKLWKDYGWPLLIGVILALIIGFGWRHYQQYKTTRAEQASVIYAQLLVADMSGQFKEVQQQTDVLMKSYRDTPYASLSALFSAKEAVAQNKLPDAVTALKWVIDNGKGKVFKEIAHLRLARVYLSLNRPNDALKEISKKSDGHFEPLRLSIEGDAYLQLKQIDQAKKAYIQALNLLPETAAIRTIVEMKLKSLPG